MVNNIYLRLLNDVDIQLSPTTASNNILIKTADNLTVDIIQPKRLVAIGESYEGLMFPVGSYEDYGMVKVNDDTGLIITNGVLEIEANRFVEIDQGVQNYNKFLYVKSDGKVGLTQAGGIPTKTSDLENDGEDGINPFITEEDIPTNISHFANDMGYVLPADLPSKTSDLYNDSDFISRNDGDFIPRSEVPTKTSDLINDGEGDTSPGARFATLGDAEGLISIQSISVNGDTQYPDQNKCVSLTIPTEYAVDIEAEISPNDYVMTLRLKSENGYIGGTAVVDLPLETMVVDGRYDSTNQEVVLILASGGEVSFPVADLIAGLQSEITSTNKLSSDLVDDTNATNKFMTSAEKTKLAGIASGAEVNVQSDWNQTDSTADDYIKNKPNIPAGVVVDSTLDTTSSNAIANSAVATAVNNLQSTKQNVIDSTHKVSADNVDDTSTTNKFVTTSEKSTWNGKQNALTQTQLDAVNSGIDSTKVAQIGTNATNITNLQSNKVSKTNNANRLYGTDQYGNQSSSTYSSTGGAWTFVQRNADGNVQVALTPTDNSSATSKSYVDFALGSKLYKTTSPRRVYCTDVNGEQVHEVLDDSVSTWSVVQRDSRGNVRGKAFYGNTVKTYANSYWNYSGSRCVHIGKLHAGWDNHSIGGTIYTHNGFNVGDRTQTIINFNITVGNDGNGTDTVQGFATKVRGASAGYDWGSEALYLVRIPNTSWEWEMYYVMPGWSDMVIEINMAADSNADFYIDFDNAHDNFVTEPSSYDLKIVPINNDPPLLEIDNNWGTWGSRSWYATWRTEIPVRQNGVTRILKVIGGFTPSEEGQKTVNFRMIWDTNNDVFSTDCLGFYSVGIRNGSTANGWQYATWSKSSATLTQISSGSVWFAIGY